MFHGLAKHRIVVMSMAYCVLQNTLRQNGTPAVPPIDVVSKYRDVVDQLPSSYRPPR